MAQIFVRKFSRNVPSVVSTNFHDPRWWFAGTRLSQAIPTATGWHIPPRRVIVYTKLPAAPVVGPADWTDPNAVQSALLPVGTTQSDGPA